MAADANSVHYRSVLFQAVFLGQLRGFDMQTLVDSCDGCSDVPRTQSHRRREAPSSSRVRTLWRATSDEITYERRRSYR